MYCEPGLGFLRTYGWLIKMARSTKSNCLARHHDASRMPIPRVFDKGLIYPAVTRNLHFLHAAIAMSNKRFLQKFVLPFSTKIFYLYELVIKWSDEGKISGPSPQTERGVVVFRCLRSMTLQLRIWFLRCLYKSRREEFRNRDSLTSDRVIDWRSTRKTIKMTHSRGNNEQREYAPSQLYRVFPKSRCDFS